jgi:hypothetical protein
MRPKETPKKPKFSKNWCVPNNVIEGSERQAERQWEKCQVGNFVAKNTSCPNK